MLYEQTMNAKAIREKFGNDFVADAYTFKMGIDQRISEHIARRFRKRMVLETCTGAGFTTVSLAHVATKVTTVEINPVCYDQARKNLEIAGLSKNVSFILADILDETILNKLPPVDAAFIDPDWADSGPGHKYKFINSTTRPPADVLFERIFRITENIALILPPYIDIREFKGLPDNERELIYLGESHELFCLYFGELMSTSAETEFRVTR